VDLIAKDCRNMGRSPWGKILDLPWRFYRWNLKILNTRGY
jgi:hypothetical protein